MTKQDQIKELAYILCLTYYTGMIDGKWGSNIRKNTKGTNAIITITDNEWEKFLPHAKQLINCIIPKKQCKPKSSIINSILELDINY